MLMSFTSTTEAPLRLTLTRNWNSFWFSQLEHDQRPPPSRRHDREPDGRKQLLRWRWPSQEIPDSRRIGLVLRISPPVETMIFGNMQHLPAVGVQLIE